MKIAIHDTEKSSGYPNLALMKISAWHKAQGDSVAWFNPLFADYDKVYSSKVFTFTPKDPYLPPDAVKGGTGYGIANNLPDEIEHVCPDYDLYGLKQSYGFLTRGCIRKCDGCFVPWKEGHIKAHADIEEFSRHKEVILMDNNVLACDHGIKQIEKIIKLKLKVDFNQGLDARLIDSSVARLLSKVKWLNPIRLACDHPGMVEPIRKAVELLRWHNAQPRRYFCYVLVKDVDEAVERVRFLKGIDVDPFAQPYRDKDGNEPTEDQKMFARWVDMKAEYKSRTWEDYRLAHTA